MGNNSAIQGAWQINCERLHQNLKRPSLYPGKSPWGLLVQSSANFFFTYRHEPGRKRGGGRGGKAKKNVELRCRREVRSLQDTMVWMVNSMNGALIQKLFWARWDGWMICLKEITDFSMDPDCPWMLYITWCIVQVYPRRQANLLLCTTFYNHPGAHFLFLLNQSAGFFSNENYHGSSRIQEGSTWTKSLAKSGIRGSTAVRPSRKSLWITMEKRSGWHFARWAFLNFAF